MAVYTRAVGARLPLQSRAMERLSVAELEHEADAFRVAARATPGIDHFCSATDWMCAAYDAWESNLEPWIWRGQAGYAAFLRERVQECWALTPFDRMWGYSCPLVGANALQLANEFAATLASHPEQWELLVVTGLQEGSPLWTALLIELHRGHTLGLGQPQQRWQASLEGGFDGFLSRRTSKLRREWARMERRAAERGVTFETGSGDASALFARVLAVEDRSWKAEAQTGLHIEEMHDFYAALLPRLHARGGLRLLFARLDGTDIGYILGGVNGDEYRGLQFSFDNRLRDLGIGNLLQLAEIRRLCEENFTLYDLGIDIDYKERWADERVETATLVVRREPG